MLCLKNAASGTNLIEATHILFVEPINAPQKEIQIIEHQAIARACRIGQKNPVMVIRILIENTIEEDIYRRNYDNSAVVSFTDPSFMIT
jgi:SNF2 family DNA or RNA helicase